MVLQKLREEFTSGGRLELFEAMKPHLWSDEPAVSYADLAARLDMTVVAVKVTVHRLRHRYRDLLREEIAHTIADPSEIDDEICHFARSCEHRAYSRRREHRRPALLLDGLRRGTKSGRAQR
jgi:hypothetical protein